VFVTPKIGSKKQAESIKIIYIYIQGVQLKTEPRRKANLTGLHFRILYVLHNILYITYCTLHIYILCIIYYIIYYILFIIHYILYIIFENLRPLN
jgi:hypothetical protein